jgi:hypothetical protein
MLTFDDDATPHAKSGAADWRESYYCNFFDNDSDLCGLFWQGVRPNTKNGEAVFLLFDGSKDLVRAVDFNISWPQDQPERRRSVGPQTFTCIEPWNRWRAQYKAGADQLTVDWTRLSAVCDWEWGDLISDSKHFQAAGKVNVEGIVGGRRIRFAGYGERDRAWGDRNYGALRVCFFFTIQFRDDVALHTFVLLNPASGKYLLIGYLHKDGVTRGLASFDGNFSYAGPNGVPAKGRATFVDDTGRKAEMTFEVMNYLGMGTEPNGAELIEDIRGSKNIGYLSMQRFVRQDGVEGRGMIDHNFWAGESPESVHATAPPLFSVLYDADLAHRTLTAR